MTRNRNLLTRICAVQIAEKRTVTYYNEMVSGGISEMYITSLSKKKRPSLEKEIEIFWELLNG